MPRDPALKPFRIAMYCIYGAFCAVLFVQIVRSVVADLYGRKPQTAAEQTPTACLDDVERLYAQISARAVQPRPAASRVERLRGNGMPGRGGGTTISIG